MTKDGMYPYTTNIYNVENILTKHERGVDTEDVLENILSENKDSIKPKVSGVALSSVPMIEIRNSTITSIDQTKRQEKGNVIGPRVKDTGHEISKVWMKKTLGGIHAPVENSIRTMTTSRSRTNGYKTMSMANIIIFSALFGVVLTKEIGEIKENSLLKESSR